VGSWRVRHAEPSSIATDSSIRVVLFKTALTTGWDCPRAEVMISFRAAQDTTTIAQLVGRMVRTPLAMSAHGNDRLNEVYLFLPRYDEDAVDAIVERLTADKEAVPGSHITTAARAAIFTLRKDLKPVLDRLKELPSYTVSSKRKTSSLRRLIRLGRLLMQDEISADAQDKSVGRIVDLLTEHLADRLARDPAFDRRLHALETVTYQSVILHAGEMRVERGAARSVAVTARDTETLFARAKGLLTEEVAMAALAAALRCRGAASRKTGSL
jgi:type III restriction enzyme